MIGGGVEVMAEQGREMNPPGLSEKYFYFFMSLLIAAVVIYGFSQTVETKLIHAAPPRPLVLYVHGAVFFGWLLFFILQSALVRTRMVQWHKRIGWFGVGLGLAMFVVGVSTAVTMARFNRIILHSRYPEANLLISFFDISAFTIPFALAIFWRKKPEFHRRTQFLACCALTAAAFGRFPPPLLSPATRHSLTALAFTGWVRLYAGVDVLILVAATRDVIVGRRIRPVYLYGFLACVVCQALVLYTVVHHSAWWVKTAQALLG
jgi:hypothetical protein